MRNAVRGSAVRCICGYEARDKVDLSEHCIAMARANDPEDHCEARR